MLPINKRPVLSHLFDRVKKAKNIDQIILCTSDHSEDKDLIKWAVKNGYDYFKGHQDDVIKRLYDAAIEYSLDYVVSITGDCPLVDVSYVDKIIAKYKQTQADLITAFDLPHGSYAYGISITSLKRILEIKRSSNTEVWGRYYTDTDLFKLEKLKIKKRHNRPEIRLTLDYPEDYKFFKKIFRNINHINDYDSLDKIINYLDKHPEVVNINNGCEKKYFERYIQQSEIKLKKRYNVDTALIFGCGSIGQRHIASLKKIGVKKIKAIRTRKGYFNKLPDVSGIQEFNTYKNNLARDADIAIIANPTSMHIKTAIKVAPNVNGIFIEKPLSNTINDFKQLEEVVARNRVKTFVGFNMQFHPIVKKISNMIREQLLGVPINLQLSVGHWLPDWHPYEDYSKTYAAKSGMGGGVTLTLIHEIQMALAWMGPVNRLASNVYTDSALKIDVDTNSSIMLVHENNHTSQIFLNYIQKPFNRSGQIQFTHGYLRYDMVKSIINYRSCEDKRENTIKFKPAYNCYEESYINMMKQFKRYVEEGRYHHDFDIWEAKISLDIACAVLEPENTDKWINL